MQEQLHRPVSLANRIRSRTVPGGAVVRGRRAGRGVLMAKVNRWPPVLVKRSCTSACGRFLWTITRMPSRKDDRSSMPEISATHAPGRTRQPALDQPVEGGPERLRHHLMETPERGTEVATLSQTNSRKCFNIRVSLRS